MDLEIGVFCWTGSLVNEEGDLVVPRRKVLGALWPQASHNYHYSVFLINVGEISTQKRLTIVLKFLTLWVSA